MPHDRVLLAGRVTMKWIRRFCFGAMVLLALANSADAAEPLRVLLLHSFGPYFSPFNTITPQFREELRKRSPHPIDIYEASLQSERSGQVPAPEEGLFIDYLNSLFPTHDLSLIVAMGAPATRFVLRNRPRLFPSSPLLIAASDVRTFSNFALAANETACPTKIDEVEAIDHFLKILPDTTNIVVAIGGSPIERFWTDALRRSLQRFSPRIKFDWLTDLSAGDMVKLVAELPSHSAIFYSTVRVDASGVPQEGDVMLFRFIELGRAPIFTYVDSHFGQGIVGGPMLSSRDIAQRCAEVAVRVLNGETASDIKMPPLGMGAPVYDWRQLQRWHISESVLPPGSKIQFRQPTAWEQYRTATLAVTAALLVQSVLIVWLLYEQRRRKIAEANSLQRVNELVRMNRFATAGELSASIAHELNQPLGAILANTEAAELMLDSPVLDIEEIKTILADIKGDDQRATEVIERLRRLLTKAQVEDRDIDLNEIVTEVIGIPAALAAARDITLDAVLTPRPLIITGDSIQLGQVILNLVGNAIDALAEVRRDNRRITVRTNLPDDDTAELSVSDTGPGVRPDVLEQIFEPFVTTKNGGMGMGLAIACTIVKAHGGRLWVENQAGGGAIFRLTLPLNTFI
jgi:signal transduction histidine kinase